MARATALALLVPLGTLATHEEEGATMPKYRFAIEVDVPDDDENADDPEWWADAATEALGEYGAEATYFLTEVE